MYQSKSKRQSDHNSYCAPWLSPINDVVDVRIVVFVGATHGEVDEGEEGIGDGIGQRVKGVLKLPRPVGDREVNNVDDWQEEGAGEIFEVKIILLWVVYERPVGGADQH